MLGTIIAYFQRISKARPSVKEPKIKTDLVDGLTLRNTVSVDKATGRTEIFEVGKPCVMEHQTTGFNWVTEKGELLAELEKLTLSPSVSQAKASVTTANSLFKYAKLTYDRTKQLYESDTVTLASFSPCQNGEKESISGAWFNNTLFHPSFNLDLSFLLEYTLLSIKHLAS